MAELSDNTNDQQSMTLLVSEFARNAQVHVQSDIGSGFLRDLVDGFPSNPVLAQRAMRELLSRAPGNFCAAALQVLRLTASSQGHDYLVGLVIEADMLLIALTDPAAFPMDTAAALAKNLSRLDPHLDAKLNKRLIHEEAHAAANRETGGLERILEIVDVVSDCSRQVPILMRLLRHKDRRVKSKSARLLVRAHRNSEWLQQQLRHEDPRVRANLIEGLLDTVPGEKELQLLWGSAADRKSHRVASTALLVLLKNGRTEASEQLLEMTRHPSEMWRCAAAWALMKTNDCTYLETLQKMARSDTGNARRMALQASVHLRKMQAANRVGEAAGEGKEGAGVAEPTATI